MRGTKHCWVGIVITALALGGCSSQPTAKQLSSDPVDFSVPPKPAPTKAAAKPTKAPHRPSRAKPTAASLVAYSSCPQMLSALRREAATEVGPYGLVGSYFVGGVASSGRDSGAAMPASASTGSLARTDFSLTNNQEANVDEPDLVKTNGEVLVVAPTTDHRLKVFDVSGDRPVLRGSLGIPGDEQVQVLLIGDDVITISNTFTRQQPQAIARVISIADPSKPQVVRTFYVEGQLVDARVVHGKVLLVTQSQPLLPFIYPKDGTPAAQRLATTRNQAVVRGATKDQLLPKVVVTPENHDYQPECTKALHSRSVRSGIGTTSVVTIDPSQQEPVENLTVVGSESVVYASTSVLYLATQSWEAQMAVWQGRAARSTTNLHGLDISTPSSVRYLGTGSVPGTLIGQYAMSEHQGNLRVATTVDMAAPARAPQRMPLTDSRVTVLTPRDGALVPVGSVAGLGRGERITAVRFVGELAYVVTFRNTDPLYVVDLSRPSRPRVRGELKVTGFSSTLQPLGDGLLLGIGRAFDAAGRESQGAQVSVFDVTRPTKPSLVSRDVLERTSSLAESDQHSLLWWAPTRLLVIPADRYDTGAFGSVAYRISARGVLAEVGRITAPPAAKGQCCPSTIQRSVVIGDLLYSITERSIGTAPMDELGKQAWLAYT